jgi:hypothetical protein
MKTRHMNNMSFASKDDMSSLSMDGASYTLIFFFKIKIRDKYHVVRPLN